VKIIEELKKRNFKVATIKHTHHNMEFDKVGSDTFKHKQAGSDITVGVGDSSFFNINTNFSLERLLFLIKIVENPDFVIVEGFKHYNYPKISTSPNLVDEFTIKTVDSFKITDKEISILVDDIEKLGYDIINTLYTNECGYSDSVSIGKAIFNGDLVYNPNDFPVNLSVDGHVIGLNFFTSNFIKNSIMGMLKSLKTENFGVKDFNKIELIINNKNNNKNTNVKNKD
jgi:molybdopterin-guanine dinucleotide biosynthesis protein B